MTKHGNDKTWVVHKVAQSRQSLVNKRKEINKKGKRRPQGHATGSRDTHGVTTHLQRQAARVKGDVEVGWGFEADTAEVDVLDEVLRPAGEELVRRGEAPRDASDVGIPVGGGAGNGRPGRSTKGAMEDEVVEGVGGPAARACELIEGDVGPEPGRVVGREGVSDRKAEGGGGGVPRVPRDAAARVGVFVGSDGRRPKGVVGAVGGVEKGILVGPGGGTWGSAAPCLPVLGPEGKGALTSDSLGMCRRLNPVKGGAWGKATRRKGFEPCRIVHDPEPLRW